MEAASLSLAEAARRSGWPQEAVEDFCKWPVVVESSYSFLNFVRYGNHSQGQMCVLKGGLEKLGLEDALPLREACRTQRSAVQAVMSCDLDMEGDVFVWGDDPGELWCKRREIKDGSLRERLRRAEGEAIVYLAELSHAVKSPHHLTGELCRSLSRRDVRDLGEPGQELPMWDRGHAFVGGEGSGSCLHVDQAWWSNIAKNYTGYKLVAVWGPDAAVLPLAGQLFRRPLSEEQTNALRKASTIALLGPGDVASFTGGLPHVTLVVGDELNLTAYESFVNWHPSNARLLLQGARRKPGEDGAMKRGALHGLLDDVVQVVKRRAPEAIDLHPGRRVVLLTLGSSNDDDGVVDGEVHHRARRLVVLWRSLGEAKEVKILTSGGSDPERFFNRTRRPHWHYVQQVLLSLGMSAAALGDGLEALHTVDEALMTRQRLENMEGEIELIVITSAFHAPRARHLFHVAFADLLRVEVLVLAVPNACQGDLLESYTAKEQRSLKALRAAPYGTWLDYLRKKNLEKLNESLLPSEAFFLSSEGADARRGTVRQVLKGFKRCRRRLCQDSPSSRSSSQSAKRLRSE